MKELEALCHLLYPSLERYFFSALQDAHLAEELTQETLYQACKSKPLFKGNASLKTWIFAIACNVLKTYYTKKSRSSRFTSPIFVESSPSPEVDLLQQEAYLELMQQLLTFSELEQQVILLRGYADLDFKSIADILEIKENHARVLFYRTKQKLRMRLTLEKEN